jgi:trehalose synthase
VSRLSVARPAVDPCCQRNAPLPPDVVESVVATLGIDPGRPLIGQFSPIDTRFAPLAALGTYWLVRRTIPDVQIVLAEVGLTDPARREKGLEQVTAAAAGDSDIHLISRESGLGPTEINALQRACAVVLQMAVPGGYGWGLFDCLWKERPVVVGQQGELPQQVGKAGLVVDAAPAAADAVIRLLTDPALAATFGRRGRDRVLANHLVTDLAGDYVQLLREIVDPIRVASSVH